MAQKKISELSGISNLATGDFLVAVDVSANQTKKINFANAKKTYSLDVSKLNIENNSVEVVGPAFATTTDHAAFFLPSGGNASGSSHDFKEILISTDGSFQANIELADASGVVLDSGVLGSVGTVEFDQYGEITDTFKIVVGNGTDNAEVLPKISSSIKGGGYPSSSQIKVYGKVNFIKAYHEFDFYPGVNRYEFAMFDIETRDDSAALIFASGNPQFSNSFNVKFYGEYDGYTGNGAVTAEGYVTRYGKYKKTTSADMQPQNPTGLNLGQRLEFTQTKIKKNINLALEMNGLTYDKSGSSNYGNKLSFAFGTELSFDLRDFEDENAPWVSVYSESGTHNGRTAYTGQDGNAGYKVLYNNTQDRYEMISGSDIAFHTSATVRNSDLYVHTGISSLNREEWIPDFEDWQDGSATVDIFQRTNHIDTFLGFNRHYTIS